MDLITLPDNLGQNLIHRPLTKTRNTGEKLPWIKEFGHNTLLNSLSTRANKIRVRKMQIIKLLFSMSGRMNRMTYVLMSLIVGVLGYSLSIGFELASAANPKDGVISASWAVIILSLYVQAAMLTKRIRDTGSSTALVWIYYAGILLGFPLLFFGLVSIIALVVGFILLGITVIITLYAVFAGSAPIDNESKSGKSTFHGLAFSDPSANSEGQQAYNANADAIIARAVAERREAQQSAREHAQKPTSSSGQPTGKVGFGKRTSPTFGHS